MFFVHNWQWTRFTNNTALSSMEPTFIKEPGREWVLGCWLEATYQRELPLKTDAPIVHFDIKLPPTLCNHTKRKIMSILPSQLMLGQIYSIQYIFLSSVHFTFASPSLNFLTDCLPSHYSKKVTSDCRMLQNTTSLKPHHLILRSDLIKKLKVSVTWKA